MELKQQQSLDGSPASLAVHLVVVSDDKMSTIVSDDSFIPVR